MRISLAPLLLTVTLAGASARAQVGYISTVAGGYTNDLRPALDVNMSCNAVAVGRHGDVFLAGGIYGSFPVPWGAGARIDSSRILSSIVLGCETTGCEMPDGSSHFNYGLDVAVDAAGQAYFATSLSQVFRLDLDGRIEVVAGNRINDYSGDGGPAVDASLAFEPRFEDDFPVRIGAIAISPGGDLYIADSHNHRIRRVHNGIITTVVGTGEKGFSGDDGPALSARLHLPAGLAFDAVGNLYISDTQNNRIRRVDAETQIITTIAGDGTGRDQGDEMPGTSVGIQWPRGLAFDDLGNLYLADRNHSRLRWLDLHGIIHGVAGTEGLAVTDVDLDDAGGIFFSDSNGDRIYRVDTLGSIEPFAGTGQAEPPVYCGDGEPALGSCLGAVRSIAFDSSGSLFLSTGNRLRSIVAGILETLDEDEFQSVAVNASGEVAFTRGHAVFLRHLDGAVTRIAGSVEGYDGDGGPAVQALLAFPSGLAFAPDGSLYIADTFNNRVRKVDPDGEIGTVASVANPRDITLDDRGYFYVAFGTVSGSGGVRRYAADGSGGAVLTTRSSFYGGVAARSGVVYATDTHSNQIIRISPDGENTVFAGTGARGFSGDEGAAADATFDTPLELAIRGDLLYIADSRNQRLRAIQLPPDSDGDGIPDDSDPCPDDASGLDADQNGCTDTLSELTAYAAELEDAPGGLTRKLEDAERALEKGNIRVVINKLEDFLRQVAAQKGQSLTDEQADFLTEYATNLLLQLE